MAEHGGYRAPANPAPVSGPGALSQRTDGGATQAPMLASGGPYGSRQDMAEIQGGSPLAGNAPPPGMMPSGPSAADLPSLDAPTARPGEPVTAGAGVPGQPGATQIDPTTRERLVAALPTLMWLASQPKASEQTRQFVRQLRGDL